MPSFPSRSRLVLTLQRACLAVGLAFPLGTTRAEGLEPIRIAMIEALSGPFANAGEAVFRNLVWPEHQMGKCISWDFDGPVIARIAPQVIGLRPKTR